MTIEITHPFTSAKADGSDSTLVQPSDWNDAHDFTMATSRILGRVTGGAGAVEELTADDIYDIIGLVATTRMVFQQTAAPTGWTKDTTHNNKAFRLVSGTVSTGGSSPFTTVFGSAVASSSYALTAADIPAHSHTFSGTTSSDGSHNHTYDKADPSGSGAGGGGGAVCQGSNDSSSTSTNGAHTHTYSGTTSSVGSSGGHSHTVTLAVQYVDFIVAEKD